MTRRVRILGVGILIAALIGVAYAAYVFWGEGLQVVITEAELAAKVNEKFPITKTHLGIVQVTYSDPVVILQEGSDRVRLGLTATSRVLLDSKPLAGAATISGALSYRPESGSFFLTGIRVESLDIRGLPPRYEPIVRDLTSVALKEFFDAHPVYALKSSDVRQRLAKLVLKSVAVHHRTLVVTMGLGR